MSGRALVLGGGGTLGIAWMLGVATGLAEGQVQLSDADLIVGTSAGSVVGTLLAHKVSPTELLGRFQGGLELPPVGEGRSDPEVAEVSALWSASAEMSTELAQELGRVAMSAPTLAETDWTGAFSRILGPMDWPTRPLKVTAVDARTGQLVVWEGQPGVDLALAVASSCTVPGLFPPVTIQEQRYMDGGVLSTTHGGLAAGYDQVLIIAPLGGPWSPFGQACLQREVNALRNEGSQVEVLLPDEQTSQQLGPNLMDASRIPIAFMEGWRQGQVAAAGLATFWGQV